MSSFGFVNFVSHEHARQACDELNETDFKGKRIFVGRAQKRTERDEELKKSHEEKRMENEAKSAGVNLYVKNLDGTSFDGTPTQANIYQMSGMTSAFVQSSRLLVPSLAAE